jgi:hypothetical protein
MVEVSTALSQMRALPHLIPVQSSQPSLLILLATRLRLALHTANLDQANLIAQYGLCILTVWSLRFGRIFRKHFGKLL